MHIQNTGVQLKRDLSCSSHRADIGIPAVRSSERDDHPTDFQSIGSQWSVYLFLAFHVCHD